MRFGKPISVLILLIAMTTVWGGFLCGQELPPSRNDIYAIIKETGVAIEEQPKNSKLYYRRALIYKQLGEYEKALADLKKATRLHPRFAHAFYERGLVHKILEQYNLAEKYLTKAVRLDASMSEVYKPLDFDLDAILENYRNKTSVRKPEEDTSVSIKGATLPFPDSREEKETESSYYGAEEKPKTTAISNRETERQETVVTESGASIPSWRNIPVTPDELSTETTGSSPKPKHTPQIIGSGKSSEDLIASYGQAMSQGNVNEALGILSQIIANHPSSPDNYLTRAKLYRHLQNFEAAKTDLNMAYSLAPESNEIFLEWGILNIVSGKLNEAVAGLNKSIELEPINPNAYLHRGLVWQKAGKAEEAFSDYAKTIELAPDMMGGYFYRGNLFLALGQFEEALIDVNKALELDPENGRAFFLRGEIQMSRGKKMEFSGDMGKALAIYRNAGSDYTQALSFDPTNKIFEESRNKAREQVAKIKSLEEPEIH